MGLDYISYDVFDLERLVRSNLLLIFIYASDFARNKMIYVLNKSDWSTKSVTSLVHETSCVRRTRAPNRLLVSDGTVVRLAETSESSECELYFGNTVLYCLV